MGHTDSVNVDVCVTNPVTGGPILWYATATVFGVDCTNMSPDQIADAIARKYLMRVESHKSWIAHATKLGNGMIAIGDALGIQVSGDQQLEGFGDKAVEHIEQIHASHANQIQAVHDAVALYCPFSLRCRKCDAGDDVEALNDALCGGWANVDFDPTGSSWFWLGDCPDCKSD